MRKPSISFGIIALAILIAGCAAIPHQPIADFAAATAKADDGFTDLNKRAAHALYDKDNDASAIRQKIVFADGCGPRSSGCSVRIKDKNGALVPLHPNVVVPKSVHFLNAMHRYAEALDALDKADAKQDVEATMAKVYGVMTGVATALNLPVGAALAALKEPVTSAGGALYGWDQDQRKLAALQKATAAADPIIQEAVPILSAESTFLETTILTPLRSDFDKKREIFQETPTPETLKAVTDSAATLDVAIKAKGTSPVAALAAAHAELTQVVARPDALTTLAALDQFGTIAGDLATAAHDVQKGNPQ